MPLKWILDTLLTRPLLPFRTECAVCCLLLVNCYINNGSFRGLFSVVFCSVHGGVGCAAALGLRRVLPAITFRAAAGYLLRWHAPGPASTWRPGRATLVRFAFRIWSAGLCGLQAFSGLR